MEPENQTALNAPPATNDDQTTPVIAPGEPIPAAKSERGLRWIFIGSQGLRAGWSVLITTFLFVLFDWVLGEMLIHTHLVRKGAQFLLRSMFLAELAAVLSLLGAVFVVGLIERRRVLDYNLAGPRRAQHFLSGLLGGFLALSALVGALAAGGWLHFGPMALSGTGILRYGAYWGGFFLLVGCFEEGSSRCYLLYTLTRGINFWWALFLVAVMCTDLVISIRGNGAWGVYVIAILGLLPCLVLHLRAAPHSGFWQAAWVTSTFFGFVHTANNGENWVGIFQAAAIGFIFCVSVRVTGSAWWAIGCHAAWDWAETFFYGAADSGLQAQGHFLTVSPAGNKLWSGGLDGPEGSILGIPVLLLLVLALLLIYGRKKPAAPAALPAAPSVV